jgi:hypothetical protein
MTLIVTDNTRGADQIDFRPIVYLTVSQNKKATDLVGGFVSFMACLSQADLMFNVQFSMFNC